MFFSNIHGFLVHHLFVSISPVNTGWGKFRQCWFCLFKWCSPKRHSSMGIGIGAFIGRDLHRHISRGWAIILKHSKTFQNISKHAKNSIEPSDDPLKIAIPWDMAGWNMLDFLFELNGGWFHYRKIFLISMIFLLVHGFQMLEEPCLMKEAKSTMLLGEITEKSFI